MSVTPSKLDTVPTVIFQRLHAKTGQPIEVHAIVFESADDAKTRAKQIELDNELKLLAVVDAVISRCHPE